MVTPGSLGTGGTHRCSRAFRCCASANQASSKCSSSRILPTAFSATPPVSTSRVAPVARNRWSTTWIMASSNTSCVAAALSRRSLVSAPVMDVLDAQHRVGIPQLLRLERCAEDVGQRWLVRVVKRVAVPVGHGAVQQDFAVRTEDAARYAAGVIGIGRAVHVAPGRGAHVASLAGQPGPAALRRRDHAVEGAERVEHAVVAIEPSHLAVLHDVERDRAEIAGAVEHRDRDRLAVVLERGGGIREPGVVVMVRHADQRHAFGESELAGEDLRRARHLVEAPAVEAGGFVVRDNFRLCGSSSSTERASVPASVG